jgi:phosphate:Na+ symporter
MNAENEYVRTDKEKYQRSRVELSEVARRNLYGTGTTIDRLIRKELVTVDMGSSLVNDHDNVNDTIEKLIEIADLLYGEKDPLFKEGLPTMSGPVYRQG